MSLMRPAIGLGHSLSRAFMSLRIGTAGHFSGSLNTGSSSESVLSGTALPRIFAVADAASSESMYPNTFLAASFRSEAEVRTYSQAPMRVMSLSGSADHFGVSGRVGGVVTEPRPSQTRACAIDALGSSLGRFAQGA